MGLSRTWQRIDAPRVALAALLLLSVGCGPRQPEAGAPTGQRNGSPQERTVPVTTQPVLQGPIASTVQYAGNVQSNSSVQVMPRATGRIEQLGADVGSAVKAGDLLAVLDRSQLQASTQQAEGSLRAAEAKLASLMAQGRPEDVEAAASQLAAAEEKLALMLQGGRQGDVAAAEASAAAARTKVAQVLEATRSAIASAQATVDSNRANLRSAREKLEQLTSGGAPSDRAAAEAAVEAAQGSLDEALAQRDLLVNPPAATVQSARSDVEKAEASLAQAQASLEQLMSGGAPSDRAQAEAGVESAYAALRQAQQNLLVLQGGGTPSQRGQAQAAVDTAVSQLRANRTEYQQIATLRSSADTTMALQQEATQQQRALENARAQAQSACSGGGGGLGGPLSSAGGGNASGLSCAAAQAYLSQVQVAYNLVQLALGAGGRGTDPSRVAAARANLDAAAAQVLSAQTQLADLNNPPPSTLQTARAAVDQAQANLDGAVAKLDALQNPPLASRVQAETAVAQAEATLSAARENYDQVVAGGAPAQQRQADGAVAAAEGQLRQAEAKLAGLQVPAPADLAAAQAAVASAEVQLAASEAQLALAVGPQARSDLDSATASLQQAQNTLYNTRVPYRPEEIQQQREAVRQAQATLALKQEPNRPEDIAQAQASVEQARGAYNLAVEQENDAFVYAPFDGVVSARQMSLGALASPSTAIYTLVSNNVEIWVNIEESDLTYVRPGIPATMRVSPYKDETFDARVEVVSTSGDPRNRTFQTKLVAANPDGRLKDGMFAQVRFVGSTRPDATLIPITAVVSRGGLSFAYVVVDGRARQRELQLGINDGTNVEVRAGLQPGEQLIVAGLSTVTDGVAVTITPDLPTVPAPSRRAN
jgi:RND family efflux transporter MFP subunit